MRQARFGRAWFEGVESDEIHLSAVVGGHSQRILPVDTRVAEQWGRLTARRPGSVVDTLMAATALVHGLVLVTRNIEDVAWTGVSYLNPFESAP